MWLCTGGEDQDMSVKVPSMCMVVRLGRASRGASGSSFPLPLSNYWPIWHCLFNCFNYDGTGVAQHPGVKTCIIHVQHPGLHSELWVWAECQYRLMPPVEQRVVCIDSKADRESKGKCCQRHWIVMLSKCDRWKEFLCACVSSRSELSSQLAFAVAWYVTSLLSPPDRRINSVQLLMNHDTALFTRKSEPTNG